MKILAAAPAHAWKVPGWATPHNLALIAAAAVVAVVVIGLVRAVGRLAKLARAAAPVPAPKKPGGGGLLLLGAAGAVIWAYLKTRRPGAATSAGAQPSPSPRPTVTQTVAPHVTNFHFPLTGGDIVAMWIIGGVVAIVLVGAVLRRSS